MTQACLYCSWLINHCSQAGIRHSKLYKYIDQCAGKRTIAVASPRTRRVRGQVQYNRFSHLKSSTFTKYASQKSTCQRTIYVFEVFFKGWRWRSGDVTKRGNILRKRQLFAMMNGSVSSMRKYNTSLLVVKAFKWKLTPHLIVMGFQFYFNLLIIVCLLDRQFTNKIYHTEFTTSPG